MATSSTPIDPIMEAARAFSDVVEGTSCTQTSFKRGKKAFLYIGTQGGRYKAMFKLDASLDDARSRAAKTPEQVEVGKIGWVTTRFTGDKPLPARLWKKWLRESYDLAS